MAALYPVSAVAHFPSLPAATIGSTSRPRPPRRPRPPPRLSASVGTAASVASASQLRRGVKAKNKEDAPDYSKFSDDLIVVLQNAEKNALELNQAQIGTDALLLTLLTVSELESPNAQATRLAAFPGIEADAVAAFLQQSSETSTSSRRKASGGPMMFTPMTRRTLTTAQQEQERLGHEAVEPAHLLLALLKEPQGQSTQLLQRFDQSPEEVRRRVLGTLEGPLAKLRLTAANELLKLKKEVTMAAPKEEPPLAAKLRTAYEQLTGGLVERSVEAKLLLLAALSGEHLFLLGPPGTAKSLLARRVASVCRGQFFERLLTRFSVPEEVFGPLSLRALENDELRRKVEGYLPTADVAFLDEIFKANSSILNALLTLLNERRFDNGGERMDVPLWCAVAASNELPESDELDALFDRFLLRRQVPRVSDGQVPDFLRSSLDHSARESGPGPDTVEEPMLSVVDSIESQSLASKTTFPSHLLDLVVSLRAYLRDEAEPPVNLSDRRLGKAVRLIRLAATTAGATEVSELDLLLLQHICWDKEPSQAGEVRVWLLERMRCADKEDGSADLDMVEKVKFLLAGVKMRLRRTPRSGGTISMAQTDLESMRKVLDDGLKTRQKRLVQLRSILQDHSAHRLFWLEEADILEAQDALIPAAEQGVEKAAETLKDVLELQGALDLDPSTREMCLDALLDDFKDGEINDDLNRAMQRIPAGGLALGGRFPL